MGGLTSHLCRMHTFQLTTPTYHATESEPFCLTSTTTQSRNQHVRRNRPGHLVVHARVAKGKPLGIYPSFQGLPSSVYVQATKNRQLDVDMILFHFFELTAIGEFETHDHPLQMFLRDQHGGLWRHGTLNDNEFEQLIWPAPPRPTEPEEFFTAQRLVAEIDKLEREISWMGNKDHPYFNEAGAANARQFQKLLMDRFLQAFPKKKLQEQQNWGRYKYRVVDAAE